MFLHFYRCVLKLALLLYLVRVTSSQISLFIFMSFPFSQCLSYLGLKLLPIIRRKSMSLRLTMYDYTPLRRWSFFAEECSNFHVSSYAFILAEFHAEDRWIFHLDMMCRCLCLPVETSSPTKFHKDEVRGRYTTLLNCVELACRIDHLIIFCLLD